MSTVASTCSTSATDRAGAACTRDDAQELWSIAQQLNNCEGYAEYLRVCPTANRAGFAKVMRQKLGCDTDSAPAAASATTPAATPEPPAFPREDDYRSAQTELGRLGFYRGGVDGAWGPGSQSAMRAFQQGAGLSPDGRLTEASLAALKAAPTPAPSAPSSASLASGSAGPCRDCADALTVVSWGGAYSRSQQKAYAEPYQRLFPSVRITHDQSSAESVARLRAMREAGYVTWDLVDVVAADGIRLCDEGLAAPIDPDRDLAAAPDGSPARSDFGATLISACFIPQIIYSKTIGYRTDVADWRGRTPTSICDLFDLGAFPGRRSLEQRPTGNVEWALLCDGVPKSQLYQVLSTDDGVRRALRKLDTIKSSIDWWAAGAETPRRLAERSVVMGSTYNGRLFALIEEQGGRGLDILWDAQILDLDGWIIPTGLPPERFRRALHFARYATDTRRLADQARYIAYAPARKSSFPILPRHATLGVPMAGRVPAHPDLQGSAILYNYEWWADNRARVDTLFNAWLKR